MPTTISAESLQRRIRHARANIRHAEQLQDCMDAAAWRALMDARHEALNELIDQAQENT
jgi:class 3 adenylate cyclase